LPQSTVLGVPSLSVCTCLSLASIPRQKLSPKANQKNAICAANLTMIAKNVEKAGAAVFRGGF